MPDDQRNRERIVALEQILPMVRENLKEIADKQDKMTAAVIELAEQSKRMPHVETKLHELQAQMHHMGTRMSVAEKRLDNVEDGVNAIQDLRDAVLNNKWNTVLIRAALGVVFTGAVGTFFYLIKGLIPP